MFSRFIHIVWYVNASFLFIAERHSVYAYSTFIHSSVDWHLNCFHFLPVTNDAAVNTNVQVIAFFVFISFEYIPRSGVSGSYSNSMFKELQDCFPKWLYHFIFLPAVYKSSNFFTFSPALVIACFLTIAILVSVKWYLIMFLICVFFFYWSTVDLQCCVNLYCTSKWFSYTYIYSFYILFHYGLSQNIECPVLYSRTLLFIQSIYNSWLTPDSQPACPHFPSANTSLFSMFVSLFLFHRYVHLCCILDSAYK